NLNKTTEKLKECLLSLSSKRESLKEIFESKIQKELSDLSLDKAKFSISFKREEVDEDSLNCIKIGEKYFKLFEDGLERVEFLLSTNPGQPLLPLTSIASGGELSRIMLAIKTILREVDQTPTLIFDEIDAGIGGIVGDKVGEKLYEISENKQVICITHLPQIASKADNHFTVWKEINSNDTSIKISKVIGKERITEISRMIGGDYLNDTSLKHAEEILKLNSSR
ncbi:MAG TPA: DNA repair protein RecN, partial [Caldisericia bacterium]|nr:DNA repair protein RecN [Caldisericia bacterium]